MNESYIFNALDDAIIVEEMSVIIVNEVNNASTALMVINKQSKSDDDSTSANTDKKDDKSSDSGEKKSAEVKEGILRKFLDKLKVIFRRIKEFVSKYFRKIKEFVYKYFNKLRDKIEKKEAIIAGAKKLPEDIKFKVFGGKQAFLADKIYLRDTADVIDYHIQDFVKIAEGNANGTNVNGRNDKALDELMQSFKPKSEDAYNKLTAMSDVGTDAEYNKKDIVENIEKIIKFSREFKLSDADKFERELVRKTDKAVNDLTKLRGKVSVDTKLVTAMNMVMNANQKLLSKLLDVQGKIIRNQVFAAKSIINACLNAETLKTGNTTVQ